MDKVGFWDALGLYFPAAFAPDPERVRQLKSKQSAGFVEDGALLYADISVVPPAEFGAWRRPPRQPGQMDELDKFVEKKISRKVEKLKQRGLAHPFFDIRIDAAIAAEVGCVCYDQINSHKVQNLRSAEAEARLGACVSELDAICLGPEGGSQQPAFRYDWSIPAGCVGVSLPDARAVRAASAMTQAAMEKLCAASAAAKEAARELSALMAAERARWPRVAHNRDYWAEGFVQALLFSLHRFSIDGEEVSVNELTELTEAACQSLTGRSIAESALRNALDAVDDAAHWKQLSWAERGGFWRRFIRHAAIESWPDKTRNYAFSAYYRAVWGEFYG